MWDGVGHAPCLDVACISPSCVNLYHVVCCPSELRALPTALSPLPAARHGHGDEACSRSQVHDRRGLCPRCHKRVHTQRDPCTMVPRWVAPSSSGRRAHHCFLQVDAAAVTRAHSYVGLSLHWVCGRLLGCQSYRLVISGDYHPVRFQLRVQALQAKMDWSRTRGRLPWFQPLHV